MNGEQRGEPVHIGHSHVAQHQIDSLLFHEVHGVFPGFHFKSAVMPIFKHKFQHVPMRVIIINNKQR